MSVSERVTGPKLSLGQWLAIMSALGAGLLGAASKLGIAFQGGAGDPAVVQVRSDLAKEMEENIRQKEQIWQMDFRLRQLEHQQGYDGSGDNPYYSKKPLR
jgi:hypothetical protein